MIGDRWNVTDDEVARDYPCDAFAPASSVAAWRGVTVAAPPQRVWPWLGQLRLAPYSYDWIDNLGRRSPRQLRGLPDPVVGEPFTRAAGRPIGETLAVEPGVALTGRISGTLMSYVLVPTGTTTRLLLKLVMPRLPVLSGALCVGDLVMARRQLLTFQRLAGSGGAADTPRP